jgi:AbrB family looped-hinge helix DNA binding protein
MAERISKDLSLRPKRQVTLPADVCAVLGLQVGDRLELSVEGEGRLVLRPRKALALEALRAIQAAFAASGLREEELQAAGRQVRERISRTHYAQD